MMTTSSDVLVPPFLGDYQPRLFTMADLAAMPAELPSGPVDYELHHGRLIAMTPPGNIHSSVEAKFTGAFLYQGEYAGHGKARGEVGIILGRNPDHLLGADAAFIGNNRLPIRESSEGYLETIPHVVVEVRSKNDTLAALNRKAADYLNAGVVVVWVVDPLNRNVLEHRQGAAQMPTIDDTGTLTLPDIIPGFALSVQQALQE
jgi:Uma2 family endonuclease